MRMTVGAAAQAVGVSPKAVRLWEAKGLLPAAERTEAGYRMFTDNDLEVLRFVRQAKTLGLHLDEIKDILDLQRGGEQPCGHVLSLLDMHIAEIDRRLDDLTHLRQSLSRARAAGARQHGHNAMVCRIIENPADSA
ncbi:transcriptional regulator, MerR family [Pseudonocardia ammonioxydans]|uniref:Transcriptional regulator, MerR family n=2 Tax=Pseudonocardia TaxID=1847 RepID=A0A1I5I299_PSUAM|nr:MULTISPECIES: heavy metal-responsive transcriptional regulator [Pseudonocardia]MBP2371274.1 DNA-binding transcriptional MerR regulator [Pseudonocardia parietis]SFO54663.1 transcriptional regulator, MerR family [Pseudonocardia ammonioxydans]